MNLDAPKITEIDDPNKHPLIIVNSIKKRLIEILLNWPGKYLRNENNKANPNAPPAIIPFLNLF